MPRPSNRDRILDTFETLILSHGAGSVTLELLVDATGLSKGGLLYHFPSKSDLFNGILERCSAQVDDDLASAPIDHAELIRWFIMNAYRAAGNPSSLWRSAIASVRTGEDQFDADFLALIERSYSPLKVLGAAKAAHTRLVADGLYMSEHLGVDIPSKRSVEAVIATIIAS